MKYIFIRRLFLFCLAASLAMPALAFSDDVDAVEMDQSQGILRVRGSCEEPIVIIAYYAGTSRIWSSGDPPCIGGHYDWEIVPGEWQTEGADFEVEVIRGGYERHGTRYPVTITQEEALPDTPPPQPEAPTEPEENSEEEAQQEDEGEANTDGFWARMLSAVIEWLENAIVRIKEIVAEKITTAELCLGGTCIIESQMKELLKETSVPEPEPAALAEIQDSALIDEEGVEEKIDAVSEDAEPVVESSP